MTGPGTASGVHKAWDLKHAFSLGQVLPHPQEVETVLQGGKQKFSNITILCSPPKLNPTQQNLIIS